MKFVRANSRIGEFMWFSIVDNVKDLYIIGAYGFFSYPKVNKSLKKIAKDE